MRKAYNEPYMLHDVHQFHELTRNNIEKYPIIPHYNRTNLRINLIQEELNELREAIHNNDLVEIADALCDISYVVSGSVLEFGLADIFKELFEEVHRSNMSKACNSMEEVIATKKKYTEEGYKNLGHIAGPGNKFFVIDLNNNRKTLKSINYSPANLKPIIKKAFVNAPDETDYPF